ncbi:MAG: hypothetical protein GY784_07320 [Gammaproteobacteria bacterium]|nr:hypothetical protein [Gammaproteobacteria bacterium]
MDVCLIGSLPSSVDVDEDLLPAIIWAGDVVSLRSIKPGTAACFSWFHVSRISMHHLYAPNNMIGNTAPQAIAIA